MNQSTVRLRRLGSLILKLSSNELYWPWLQREDGTVLQPLSKRSANKFILGCIIDYQVYADRAWSNAARLAETELEDPPDLWETIGNLAESAWRARRKKYLWLHPLTAAHMRVWRIGRGIRDKYGGDARRIWRGQTPEDVRDRLNELRLGPQLSRMAIGALIDTGHLTGSGDLQQTCMFGASSDDSSAVARCLRMKPLR